MVLENFLEPTFAAEVANSYPDFDTAQRMGFEFRNVNENLKVQITDYAKFPDPTKKLADALASPEFMAQLSEITGIKNLLWDGGFVGGGMHQTGSRGLLDVHVDFNLIEDKKLYRRLNLLLYLNDGWQEDWGGAVELWDPEVKVCHKSLAPVLNRCLVFQTSEHSFHGVSQLTSPPGTQRKSFAVYYYTEEAPVGWAGRSHGTIFKARPDEYLKKFALMPAEKLEKQVKKGVRAAKDAVKRLIK
ncbi:MAG: 2OG-Fe(II) oxygenase [Myxococcota bacterium]